MKRTRLRALTFLAAAGVLATACGDDGGSTASTPPAANASGPKASGATASGSDAMAMDLPASAANMKLTVTSAAAGKTVTTNEVELAVVASGFDLSCDYAGKALVDGKGHYHVLLDESLVDMFCTPTAKVSLQNVKPGKHTIAVVPAINDHAEVMANMQTVQFDYAPTAPLPAITDVAGNAKPTVKIVSPKPGATVKGDFDVVIEVTNFKNSCALYGKPAVAGYGHWHVNLDSATGPMNGMMTMLGMSCTDTFKASTVGLKTGETHSVIAILVDNGHAPFATPVTDKVDVKIG